MSQRNEFAPEERDPDFEPYDVAPPNMPPSPAGANADIGGEAAASRRNAGLPNHLARSTEHRSGRATPGAEPFLGYDGLATDDVIAWIGEADPDAARLRTILHYERVHHERDAIIRECTERLHKLGEATPS